jgi:hypothetical protein
LFPAFLSKSDGRRIFLIGYIATAVVILGCIGEYPVEFKDFPADPRKRRRFAKRSLLLLIAGLVVERWHWYRRAV